MTTTAEYTPLWVAIDQRRRDLGWTWAELGRRSQVPPTLINRWKRHRASEESIRKLATGFGMTETEMQDLLKLGGRLPRPKRAASLQKVEAAIRGEDAFTAQQKEALIAMAHALVNTQDGPNGGDPT
jgi:transcriptional regulator with XRE-family HTH domain